MTNDGSWQEGKKDTELLIKQENKTAESSTFEFYNSILSPHWPRKAALKKAYLFLQG